MRNLQILWFSEVSDGNGANTIKDSLVELYWNISLKLQIDLCKIQSSPLFFLSFFYSPREFLIHAWYLYTVEMVFSAMLWPFHIVRPQCCIDKLFISKLDEGNKEQLQMGIWAIDERKLTRYLIRWKKKTQFKNCIHLFSFAYGILKKMFD